MSRRPGVDHNNNLYKAAGGENALELLEKSLSFGLVLEEDPFTGHVYFVDRIAPAYKRDWCDERFGSDGGTAAHNAAFNGNFNALIYLLKLGQHLDVENVDKNTPIDILIEEGYEEEAEIILDEYNNGKYGNHAFDNVKEQQKQRRKETKRKQRKEMEAMLPERRRDHKKYSRMMYVNGHFIINKPYEKKSKEEIKKSKEQMEQLMFNRRYGRKRDNEKDVNDIVLRKIRSEMKAEVLGEKNIAKVFSP